MMTFSAIGNIGADVVVKNASGSNVGNFSIAVTEKYKDRAGVLQEKTTWISCALWNKDNLYPFLKKGTKVYVSGSPSANAFVTKDGTAAADLCMNVFELELLSKKEA